MPYLMSVGTAVPPHQVNQSESLEIARRMFQGHLPNLERLLQVFANSQIEKRHFCVPAAWFEREHSFAEKNRAYIEAATDLGTQAIVQCLERQHISPADIDCLIFVSSTGLATPSIDARILNRLPLSEHVTRMPLWGLGCAGGAMGLSRAKDYAAAHPDSLVLLLAVELCGLTFIRSDMSKSNLIATSLFADGAAAVLIAGDQYVSRCKPAVVGPRLVTSISTTWKDSLDIMGWEVTADGLQVIFSRDIPTLVKQEMQGIVQQLLAQQQLDLSRIRHYILHPGGAKVIAAYQQALGLAAEETRYAEEVLRQYGNMSSPTVLFVLEKSLQQPWAAGDFGILTALGPGFSSEVLLLHQEE